MKIIRIVSGKLFFDEFENIYLESKWSLIPNDETRYSLIENPGHLKMFHGPESFMALIDEPDSNYVLDIRNSFVPNNEFVKAGIIVFTKADYSLEFLEYYDALKDESSVYEYMRLVRSGNNYTAYGRNNSSGAWELVGSGDFISSGKLGLIVKGSPYTTVSQFELEYFRLSSSDIIQIINLPVGYKVELLDSSDTVISTREVQSLFTGVEFKQFEIPPFARRFKVYNELSNLIHTSDLFEVVGGDVYYFGATLEILIQGNTISQDQECFIGTFKSNEINFTVDIRNPYDVDFLYVQLSALQYQLNLGYTWVKFSTELDGEFSSQLTISNISANTTIRVYGKVVRDPINMNSIEDYKFNLQLLYN